MGGQGLPADDTAWQRQADALAQAEQALAVRDVQLRELFHRMRNNMQLIGSLVALQASSADPQMNAEFGEAAGRIRAIALSLEHPARPGDMRSVDLRAYLRALLNAVTGLDGHRNIAVSFTADAMEMATRRAVPLGLVVNELLSNAVRHAFPDRRGSLRLSARQDEGGHIAVTVADDGVGLPADIDMERPRTLGLRLVVRLARQADAAIAIRRDAGTAVTLALAPEAPRDG